MDRTITVRPRRLLRFLALAILVVMLCSALIGPLLNALDLPWSRTQRVLKLFRVEEEGNLPTWFSSFQILLASLLLATIGKLEQRKADPFARHWTGLAVIFFLLSIDEVASLHEMTTNVMRRLFGAEGLLYFAWVIPGAAFVLFVFVAYIGFLRHLPRRSRWLFVTAGAIFVCGAIGLESVGGYVYQQKELHPGGFWEAAFQVECHVEELLEMLGIWLFCYGLLDYMFPGAPETVTLQIGTGASEDSESEGSASEDGASKEPAPTVTPEEAPDPPA